MNGHSRGMNGTSFVDFCETGCRQVVDHARMAVADGAYERKFFTAFK